MRTPGSFVVSLDFELYWGVRDHCTIADYALNLVGARRAIPQMLALFREFEIHVTWAIVGLLFYETKEELLAGLPRLKPTYEDQRLSPYAYMQHIGAGEQSDPYHFGASLVRMIREAKQEIATHTFSHYYCADPGQTVQQFEADISAALAVAAGSGATVRSIVFPRNQDVSEYLDVCRRLGLTAFRGNEQSWLYSRGVRAAEPKLRRLLRLADAYINLTGHNTHLPSARSGLVNVPSSRFLRPCSRRLAAFEGLRLKRITRSMEHAAKTGEVFHLWWHPHNFGVNTEENLTFLRSILQHFEELRQSYGMESLSMGDIASRFISSHEPQACLQMVL